MRASLLVACPVELGCAPNKPSNQYLLQKHSLTHENHSPPLITHVCLQTDFRWIVLCAISRYYSNLETIKTR